MDALRETGKLLMVLGILLVGVGALLSFSGKLPFRLGRLPGDIVSSGTEWKFLFSGSDVHFAERGFEFAAVGCESFPQIKS